LHDAVDLHAAVILVGGGGSSVEIRTQLSEVGRCGCSVAACLLLPGTDTIGHTFMEVGRAHCSLDASEP
jgi:hypothetical protein